jgi:hypothetical protein
MPRLAAAPAPDFTLDDFPANSGLLALLDTAKAAVTP